MEEFDLPQIAKIDCKAPIFELPFYDPKEDDLWNISSYDLEWKWFVLFFYPADFTFVCPTELKDLADNLEKFEDLWVEILSCSTDTTFSHKAWVKHERLMQNFPYKMLSDHNLEIADIYNVLDEKTWLAWRGTYIIDPDWFIKSIEITSWPLWRNSEELIRKIEALQFMKEHPNMACPAKWTPGAKTLTPSIKIAWEVYEALND